MTVGREWRRALSWQSGVLVAVLVGGGVVVGDALLRTRDNISLLRSAGVVQSQLEETQRYACLEALLRAEVPKGAQVVDQGMPGLDYQRIAEEMTPGYRFAAVPRRGDYVVTFTASGPCHGAGVSVREVGP